MAPTACCPSSQMLPPAQAHSQQAPSPSRSAQHTGRAHPRSPTPHITYPPSLLLPYWCNSSSVFSHRVLLPLRFWNKRQYLQILNGLIGKEYTFFFLIPYWKRCKCEQSLRKLCENDTWQTWRRSVGDISGSRSSNKWKLTSQKWINSLCKSRQRACKDPWDSQIPVAQWTATVSKATENFTVNDIRWAPPAVISITETFWNQWELTPHYTAFCWKTHKHHCQIKHQAHVSPRTVPKMPQEMDGHFQNALSAKKNGHMEARGKHRRACRTDLACKHYEPRKMFHSSNWTLRFWRTLPKLAMIH